MMTLEKLPLVKVIITSWLFTRLSLFKKYYKLTAIDLSKQKNWTLNHK